MQMEDLEALRAAKRGSCPLLLGVVYLRVAPFRCVIPVAYFSVLCSTLSGHPPVRGAGWAGVVGAWGLGPGAWGCSSRTTWHWQPFFSVLLEPTALHLQLSGTETRLHSTSPSSSSPQQRCLLVANNELTIETLGEAVPSHPSANTAKDTTVERRRHDGQIFPLGPTLPYHLAAVRFHPSCRI